MKKTCFEYAKSGKCRYGTRCRYGHVLATPSSKPKKRRSRAQASLTTADSSIDQLDEFFARYPTFDYQRDQPSSQQFYRLCDFFDWDKEDEERKQAQEGFKTALVHRFNVIYGVDVHDLEPWRRLYSALNITPPPTKVHDARQVVKGLFVNLVDLVDTQKTGDRVTKFTSLEKLQDYTISTGRYFPKYSAHAGGVLKFLLREILNGRSV